MSRSKSCWVRAALLRAGLGLSVGLAGCALQSGDSDSSEDVEQSDDALTTAPAINNPPDPGDDVETGEGHDPNPQPWKTLTVLPEPGSPDPDPATTLRMTTTTTTTAPTK